MNLAIVVPPTVKSLSPRVEDVGYEIIAVEEAAE